MSIASPTVRRPVPFLHNTPIIRMSLSFRGRTSNNPRGCETSQRLVTFVIYVYSDSCPSNLDLPKEKKASAGGGAIRSCP